MQSNVVEIQSGASAAANAAAVTRPYRTRQFGAGETDMTVHKQWASRPDDERFLNLRELRAFVNDRALDCEAKVVESSALRFHADQHDGDLLQVTAPGLDAKVDMTHWSFGQVAGLVGAPASYLRKLPAFLAATNLQYGALNHRAELVKTYHNDESLQMLAVTGPEYGRIADRELVDAVMRFAGDGTGETRWKVPGMFGSGGYDPFVPVTKESTTLYASDRDVFMFLVDDTHPIVIGKTPAGEDDVVFRGFYCWNSEVGSKSLGIATFLLRGVCCNRIIWGQQDVERFLIRHSKNAPDRFVEQAAPALTRYADASGAAVLQGIEAARGAKVAADGAEAKAFLNRIGLSKSMTQQVIDAVREEEGHEPASVWDFVQGITAVARSIPNVDARVKVESLAGSLMAKAA